MFERVNLRVKIKREILKIRIVYKIIKLIIGDTSFDI